MSTDLEKEKEKLYEEIQTEEEIIAKLPAYIETNKRALLQERATHQRNLAEKLMRLEVIAEEERIASVAREHLEIHPYMLEKECPICLELVPITHPDSIHFQSCCGAIICISCCKDMLEHDINHGKKKLLKKCPLCRADYFSSDKERADGIKKFAMKGSICAQGLLAGLLYGGQNTALTRNKRQALKWIRASKDHHPTSLYMFAAMHEKGECGVEKSEEKRMSLLKLSADGGCRDAQMEYAYLWWEGMGNGKEREDAAQYASLACSEKEVKSYIWLLNQLDDEVSMQSAEWILGVLFQFGEGGLEQSLNLAQHYLQIAADKGDPYAFFSLAQVLIIVSQKRYGNKYIPGFSPVPKALYYARKSFTEKDLFKDDKQATEKPRRFTAMLEAEVKSQCANCNLRCNYGEVKLMGCVRCRAAWYCSKECQVEHWNAGHKVDCIKPKKKKAQS